MKKIFALLLALCMVFTAAFAEGTAIVGEDAQETAINVNMAAIPEGYTMDTHVEGSDVYLLFTADDWENESLPLYYASVAFSELFDGYTLTTGDLTAEEQEQVKELFIGDDDASDIVFDFSRKTVNGTDVIIMRDNSGEDEFAEIVTIWQGYFLTVGVYGVETITDDMVETALQIMGDLWVSAE